MDRDQYARMAELENDYWWFRLKRDLVKALVEKYAPDRSPVRIADLGCGTGGVLASCLGEATSFGFDSDPGALAFSRSRGLARLGRGSCLELPVASRSLDMVLLLDVLEHLKEDVAALREIRRVLRKDGRLILTVPAHPHLWSSHDEVMHHHRRYTRPLLERRFREAGLEVDQLSYGFATAYPAACAVRWFKRGLDRLRRRRSPTCRPGTASERGANETGRSTCQSGDDFVALPDWLNRGILTLCGWERPAVRDGWLPFGISLVAACHPEGAA